MKILLYAVLFFTMNVSAMDGLSGAFLGSLSSCVESCSGTTGVCIEGCGRVLPYVGPGVCALGITYYGCVRCCNACCPPKKLKMDRESDVEEKV